MKVYHVTTQHDDGTDTPRRDHYDLGLYATWEAAVQRLACDGSDYTVAYCLHEHSESEIEFYIWSKGHVRVDRQGQAVRMTLSHPTTRTQWFIEQREVRVCEA